VLIEGRWFAISDSLVEDVDHFVASLPDSRVSLIAARPGEIEADYNVRLAESSPEHLLKLDARIKRPGGPPLGQQERLLDGQQDRLRPGQSPARAPYSRR
jgi:uncharacterized protein (TIGR04141 family)